MPLLVLQVGMERAASLVDEVNVAQLTALMPYVDPANFGTICNSCQAVSDRRKPTVCQARWPVDGVQVWMAPKRSVS